MFEIAFSNITKTHREAGWKLSTAKLFELLSEWHAAWEKEWTSVVDQLDQRTDFSLQTLWSDWNLQLGRKLNGTLLKEFSTIPEFRECAVLI